MLRIGFAPGTDVFGFCDVFWYHYKKKMQFLTYIILTYDNICQYCVFKLTIMTYTTYFKAIMTYIKVVVLFHDLG